MLGPIIDREMLTLARTRVCYGGRVVVPAVMLAIIWGNFLGWDYFNGGPTTVQQTALFGRLTFTQLMVAQGIVTMQLVTALVSRSIAEEKDRKTLTFLLSTPLSSVSIVLGKLAAGLGQYLTCLFAGLPVLLLLPLFGGVEPEVVLISYVATLSVALFLAALALALSVVSRRTREAHRLTNALIPVWLIGPFLVWVIGARVVPWLYPVIRPFNELFLASSPISLLFTSLTFMSRGTFLEVATKMVALQMAGAFLLITLATLGLRPAWRLHDDGGASVLARLARKRPRRRRECGTRPILWKELHAERARGVPWLAYRALALILLVILVVGTYYAGRDAFAEVFAMGYGADYDSRGRKYFNIYVRMMSAVVGLIYALSVTGIAAESIVLERVKETWLGVIATPLSGREIIQDKMIGAIWRTRAVGVLLIALWIAGMLGGSVHPLGGVAALVCLALWSWFFAALGTYGSLRASTVASASNVAILPVLLLCVTGLVPVLLPEQVRSVLYGTLSLPFLEFLSLVSYREVYEASPAPGSVTLDVIGLATGEDHARVLWTYALGVMGAVAGAVTMTQLAYRQFDRLVGRPVRSTRTPTAESGNASRREPAPVALAADPAS